MTMGTGGKSSTDLRRKGFLIVSCLRYPAPDEVDVRSAKNGYNEQQNISDRCRAAQVQRAPRDIGVQGKRLGGGARSAVGQDVGQVNYLEALDKADKN